MSLKREAHQSSSVLTVQGRAAAIVQDVEAYRRLLDIAALAIADEGIRQGLEDARQGKTRIGQKFLPRLRSRALHTSLTSPLVPRETSPQIYKNVDASSFDAAIKGFETFYDAIFSVEEIPSDVRCRLRIAG